MRLRVGLAFSLLLALAGGAQAGEDYFLLMFGAQRTPNNPNYSHSFATFVRVSWQGSGPCPSNPTIESHTISWLPVNMRVRVFALCPECGKNFDLHTTIRWCLSEDMRVSLWGAYRIDPELYHLSLRQFGLLESGRVRYKAVDTGYPSDRVSNCIHAIATIVQGPRLRIASPGWGEMASFFLLLELEPYIIQPGCTHPWVGSALGLDQYPIIYREYRRPFSGAIGGPINRLLGGERDAIPSYGPPGR